MKHNFEHNLGIWAGTPLKFSVNWTWKPGPYR